MKRWPEPGEEFWIAVEGVGPVGGVCVSVTHGGAPTGTAVIARTEGPDLRCYRQEIHIVGDGIGAGA